MPSTYLQKILRTGNSLCVTLPSRAVRIMGLQKGQIVKTEVDPIKGTLTHIFPRPGQPSLLSNKP